MLLCVGRGCILFMLFVVHVLIVKYLSVDFAQSIFQSNCWIMNSTELHTDLKIYYIDSNHLSLR